MAGSGGEALCGEDLHQRVDVMGDGQGGRAKRMGALPYNVLHYPATLEHSALLQKHQGIKMGCFLYLVSQNVDSNNDCHTTMEAFDLSIRFSCYMRASVTACNLGKQLRPLHFKGHMHSCSYSLHQDNTPQKNETVGFLLL